MTRSVTILIPLAALSALAAGCAQQSAEGASTSAASSSGSDCFSAQSVSSFTPHGTDAVDIQVGVRRYYRLTFAGVCQNTNWVNQVALVTRSGSSFICQGMDAELVVSNSPMGPQRCLINSVTRVSDEEAKALKYYK